MNELMNEITQLKDRSFNPKHLMKTVRDGDLENFFPWISNIWTGTLQKHHILMVSEQNYLYLIMKDLSPYPKILK